MVQIDPALLAKLPVSYLEENIGNRLFVVAVTFIVLQTIFVSLYYFARRVNNTLNGVECFFFMPVSYLFTTALCVCGILEVKLGGAGRHVEAVLLQDPTGGAVMARAKIDKACEFIDLVAITGSKLVILSLYLRIFGTNKRYRIATYLVGSVIVLNWLSAFILTISICKPFAYEWDRSIPGGKCGDIIAAYQFTSVPNIVSDLGLLILPLPALYKLHVDIGTKICLYATFLMGSVGIVTAILRLVTFFRSSALFKDPTYNCVATFTYIIAEAGTYLMASCMPSLRPLKRHILGNRSLSKSLGDYISKTAKKARSSFTVPSFILKSSNSNIQPRKIGKGRPQDSDDHQSSSLQLNNVGFLKLDDHSASIHSTVTD